MFLNVFAAPRMTRSQAKRPERQTVWHCEFCSKTFPSQRGYLKHVKTHGETAGNLQLRILFKWVK